MHVDLCLLARHISLHSRLIGAFANLKITMLVVHTELSQAV